MEEFMICHCCGTVSFDGWKNDYCRPTCDDCAVEENENFKEFSDSFFESREMLMRELDELESL